ncbi:HMA2 domain-containing protein [Methylomarinum vadi]|uniref:HMA2 domain-containing protein n=1 Tax=Methylomarinum vadi TaxID=438855 RepID=UPI0004DF5F5F|nr:hypothetical protein [Methylomarinum vadi]
MSKIISSIPGRIRVRDKNLRDHDRLGQLKKELSNIAAIFELHENVRTGSLLIRFDRNAIELAAIESSIDSAVDAVIGMLPKPYTPLSKKNFNRVNKLIMLSSFGTSIAALAIPNLSLRRFWHQSTGWLFVANLGAHLYIYRKSLKRLFP